MTEKTHTLHIETTYDDRHIERWVYENQPGAAADAHAALAKRWKAVGAKFTRDRAELKLTRRYEGDDLLGPYTDVIRHEPQEQR